MVTAVATADGGNVPGMRLLCTASTAQVAQQLVLALPNCHLTANQHATSYFCWLAAYAGLSGLFCHIFHSISRYCACFKLGFSILSSGRLCSSNVFQAARIRLQECNTQEAKDKC